MILPQGHDGIIKREIGYLMDFNRNLIVRSNKKERKMSVNTDFFSRVEKHFRLEANSNY